MREGGDSTLGIGFCCVLCVVSREGLFNIPCWVDCEMKECYTFPGADGMLGVERECVGRRHNIRICGGGERARDAEKQPLHPSLPLGERRPTQNSR